MSDPYSVLGILPEASDEEVKRAYRDLARKYHPDNYQNNPLADLAEEKMKEINEAYAAITRSRSGDGAGPGDYGFQGQQYQRQYTYQQQSTDNGALYSQIRQCINMGNLIQAEQLLRSAPRQTAEWYFLSGHLAYQKGWLDEAMQHFQTAYNMEPTNVEYRQALSMMQQGGGGYRPSGYRYSSCDPCTAYMCFSLCTPWGGPCC